MAALPLRKLDQYEPDFGGESEELPTNELTSSRLQSGQLQLVGTNSDKADESSNVIDWVSRISNTQAARAPQQQRPTISLLPPPTGMYQHVTPARLAPARGHRLEIIARAFALYVALPALIVGGAAWGVVTYVGTDWIGDILSPPTQVVTDTQPADPEFMPGPDVQTAPSLPPIEGSPVELRDRGIALYQEGNAAEAIPYLEAAANRGSDDALAYYQLGLAYLAVTDRPHSVDDAELAFRTAASLQPNWAAAHHMLAESLVRGGYYEEAIGPALTATQLEPSMAEAWLTLGRAYQGAGRNSEATQAIAEAARHAPAPPLMP